MINIMRSVEAAGLEPATFGLQSRRSNHLSYAPDYPLGAGFACLLATWTHAEGST